uniref:Uncharacterized protein n=1 Tax=Panagrellus redivivus TaxID=6233 RepID=A0A7E4UTN3_PANRE
MALAHVYVRAADKVECHTKVGTRKGCTACWMVLTYDGGRTLTCLRGNFVPPELDGIKAVLNQCMKNDNNIFLYCNTNLCNQECIVTTTKPPPTTTTGALSSETEESDEDVAMGGMFSSEPSTYRIQNLLSALIIAIIPLL